MKPQGKAAKKVAAELHILHRQSFVNAAMEFLLRLYKVAGLVVHELRTPVDLSLRHSIRAWRYGFARRNYRMYALDLSGYPLDYISDHESIRLLTINGIFTEIIKNKLIFPLLMKHYGMPTPKIKGLIRKGIFISFDAATKLKPAAFLDTLREPGERIIIKPVCGKHGLGFLKVAREKEGYLLNGEGLPTGILADMIGKLDNYLVTEFVQQSEYGSRLYSDTTNTIRIVTFWDVEKSEPFIA